MVLAAAALWHAVPSRAATAGPGPETEFVERIDALRVSKGLGTLTVDPQLTAVARRWAAHLADVGRLSHNPDVAREVTAPWTRLGENVGAGCDVDSLMQAFIASPTHHAILVEPAYTAMGVGSVRDDDGCIYTVHVFMSSAPATAAAAAPAPPSPPPPPPPPPPVPPAEPARVRAVLASLQVVTAEASDDAVSHEVLDGLRGERRREPDGSVR